MSATDPSTSVTAQELTADQRAALRRLILGLADTKRLLGIRYSDWLLGAPSIETGIAASSMCQDEWGHARLLYAMLKDLDDDPQVIEHDRPAEAYTSADPLDVECPDWPSLVAMNVVVDGALTVALEGFGEGRYEMAQSRVPKMLAEEAFHRDFGHAWFRRLAAVPEARALLVGAVDRYLPRMLAWLSPDDATHRTLADAGITRTAAELLGGLSDRLDDLLASVDASADPSRAVRAGWDEARGRGPGHPDEDAVTRARGDLNRELFVE